MQPYTHPMLEPLNYELDPQRASEIYGGDLLKIYCLLWNAAVAALSEGPVVRNHLIRLEFASECFYLIAQWTEMIDLGWYHFLSKDCMGSHDFFSHENNEVMTQWVPAYDAGALKSVQEEDGISKAINFSPPSSWKLIIKECVPPAFSYAELIDQMAENKVGRPSTYASTIDAALKNKLIEDHGGHLSLASQGEFLLKAMDQLPRDLKINGKFCFDLEKDLAVIENDPRRAGEIFNQYSQRLFQQMTGLATWLDDLLIEGQALTESAMMQAAAQVKEDELINPLLDVIAEENLNHATSYEELDWDDFVFKTTLGHICFKGRIFSRKENSIRSRKKDIFKEHLKAYQGLIYFGFLAKLYCIESLVNVEFYVLKDCAAGCLYLESLRLEYDFSGRVDLENMDDEVLRANNFKAIESFYLPMGLHVSPLFKLDELKIILLENKFMK